MAQHDFVERAELDNLQRQFDSLKEEVDRLRKLLLGLEWVTAEQAGAILDCSESTISRLVSSKELPAKRNGKSLRFRLADLEAYQKGLPDANLTRGEHRVFKGLQWRLVSEVHMGDHYRTTYSCTIPLSPYGPTGPHIRPLGISKMVKRPLHTPAIPPAPLAVVFGPRDRPACPGPGRYTMALPVALTAPTAAPRKEPNRRRPGGRRRRTIVP